MKAEDFKIQIIDNKGSYTAFMNHKDFSGIVVQVEQINEIPNQMGNFFEALITNSIKEKNYEISNIDLKPIN